MNGPPSAEAAPSPSRAATPIIALIRCIVSPSLRSSKAISNVPRLRPGNQKIAYSSHFLGLRGIPRPDGERGFVFCLSAPVAISRPADPMIFRQTRKVLPMWIYRFLLALVGGSCLVMLSAALTRTAASVAPAMAAARQLPNR